MKKVATWIAKNHPCVSSPDQIGKRHVIRFWKCHRDMPHKTAYFYWLALRVLWTEILGRPSEPPRPRQMDGNGKAKAT
jgi:hypothetical protein